MTRPLTLWRIWDSSDMALSDSYFATKSEALAALRHDYGIDPRRLQPWSDMPDAWSAEGTDYGEVYLEKLTVYPTRAGIAHALKHIPHR